MVAMATQGDVEAELGRTLTSVEAGKVDAALDSASDLVRTLTNRRWAAGTYTVRRRPRGGMVVLDSPSAVTTIDAVDALGATTPLAGHVLRGSTVYNVGGDWVEITYTSTGDIPSELIRVVAAMAARDVTEDRPQGATSYAVSTGALSESAQFDQPQDSIEPTRAESKIITKYARRLGSVSLV